jgi:hypothetical protein
MTTTIIAAYAAVIATGGLSWEIYKWRRTHKTKVRVALRNALMPYGDIPRAISVEAINDNDHAIRATSWGLEANDGSGDDMVIVMPMPGSTLPGKVAAHDSGSGYSDYEEIDASPKIDFKRPAVAFVNLASGERVRSKPTTLAA